MTIKSKIRTVLDYPVKGIEFRDISTLIGDAEGLQLVVKSLKERYERNNEFDIIVGIEARGFIIGSALAYSLKKGFVMIRKPGKLPGKVISQEYQLEYGSDKMEIHADAFIPGTRVLLVDDLLATGGTVMSAIALVEKLGGVITETAFIIDLPDVGGSKKLQDNGIKIFSLTELIKSLTTIKATSASKRAIRISLNVTSRSSSEIIAFPRIEPIIFSNFSFNVPNISLQ